MKKSISYQLLKNYITMFFITTFIGLLVFIIIFNINSIGSKESIYSKINAQTLMSDNFTTIDTTEIVNLGGSLNIIDKDYKIIYTSGNSRFTSNKLTQQEFADFLVNSSGGGDVVSIEYNENKDFWLVVFLPIKIKMSFIINLNLGVPTNDTSPLVLILLIFGYFTILLISTLIYSKITAKSFIYPLTKISSSLKKMRTGDYSARISTDSSIEFSELEKSFNHMAEQLENEIYLKEESEANRKNLILYISHDLKNPLTSIIGYSELLMKEEQNSNNIINNYPKIIHENGIRANELITDLFDLSKLESSEWDLNFEPYDFSEYLRMKLIEKLPEFEVLNWDTDFNISNDEIWVSLDKKLMDRALSNLFNNVILYHNKNYKFSIELKSNKNAAILTLVNYSITELSSEVKLLDPFVRDINSSTLNPNGSGLGLTIANKIITAHLGTLNINIDKNNRFSILISLPRI